MTKKQPVYVLVYGSLRKNQYNFDTFKNLYGDSIAYMLTDTLKGYDLFSLGAYPAILPGNGEIVVDLIRCSPECYKDILNMELKAGYREETILFKGVSCKLFVYNASELPNKVKSGDWLKFKNGQIHINRQTR